MRRLLTLGVLISFFNSNAQTALDTLLMISEKQISSDTITIDSLNTYIYRHYRTYPELVRKIANKIYSVAEKIDYRRGQANALRRVGSANYVLGKSAELVDSQLKASAIYESIGDYVRMAYCQNNLGLAYLQIGEPSRAKDMFLEAVRSVDSTHHYFIAICYNNLGLTYDRLEDYDSSLYYNQLALDIRLEHNHDKGRLQATYQNMGNLYHLYLKDLDRAVEYIEKSVAINREILNYVDLAGSLINLGNIYADKGDADKAFEYYTEAIEVAKLSKDQSYIAASNKVLSEFEQNRDNAEKSLEYFKKYHEARIRSIEDQQKVEVNRLESNYTVAQKEKELVALRKEKAEQQVVQLTLTIVVILVLAGTLFIWLFAQYRIRKGKQKHLELEWELEQKNKELTSYALNFIQKNELLQGISEKVNSLKRQSDPRLVTEINQISRIMNERMRIDQDWEIFKTRFEEVHKDFFATLKERYPDIGSSELRLCSLIRLNMSMKEAAQILGISPDSVKTARYRLRKKFGMSTEDDLFEFLIQFEQRTRESV